MFYTQHSLNHSFIDLSLLNFLILQLFISVLIFIINEDPSSYFLWTKLSIYNFIYQLRCVSGNLTDATKKNSSFRFLLPKLSRGLPRLNDLVYFPIIDRQCSIGKVVHCSLFRLIFILFLTIYFNSISSIGTIKFHSSLFSLLVTLLWS